jgi:cell division protein FtsA
LFGSRRAPPRNAAIQVRAHEEQAKMGVGRNGAIAALDVGTTKISCFVARLGPDSCRVIGIGHQVSRGMRAGAVVDMEGVEHSIRAAVDAAERMAGETVREVMLSFSGGAPHSQRIVQEAAIVGHEVGDDDMRRILGQGRARVNDAGREIVHAIPMGYSVDQARGVRDPRGMFGAQLGADVHVVTVASGPTRNLAVCIERGHLGVAEVVVSAYAAGMGVLVQDEKDLGVTVLDMGGGTTGIAVFNDGNLVFTDSVPVGGAHVTTDIARGLSTPTDKAERLKTLYGSAVASSADENEMIRVPRIGEASSESAAPHPRSVLVGIVRPRIEETFELVRERLEESGYHGAAGRRLVLTGGASLLHGVPNVAARVLDKQVRIGRPIKVSGLAESTGGPAFAACAGLLNHALNGAPEALAAGPWEEEALAGPLVRVGRWVHAHL